MDPKYLARLRTETLYLQDFETDLVIKSVPGKDGGYFINQYGEDKKLDHSLDEVVRATARGKIVTADKY